MASDGTCVNDGLFPSMVQPPGNIPPIITQFMGISHGDVAYCQGFSVFLGNWFLKEK